MKKELVITLLLVFAVLMPVGQTPTRASGKDEATTIEKVKAKIAKLGVGEKARAQIKLMNGQKIKGYVSKTGENNFDFTDGGSGRTVTVSYADVLEVKKPGGLSKGAKIGIAAGVAVGVTALVILHSCGAYCR